MANLFPITNYRTGEQFEGQEMEQWKAKEQWNTVLSFANYLFERNAAVDYRVMEGVLKNRGWLKSQTLDMIQLFSGPKFPESMALAIKYQDELAGDFSSMLFDGFRQGGGRTIMFETLFDELINSAVALNKDFTRFDAVCVFLRFAVKFELAVPAPSLEWVARPTLVDAYMQPFIQVMRDTTKFNLQERELLAFVAQSISAFRLAPGFPCTCEYAAENNGASIILSHHSKRLNSWDVVERDIMAVAAGKEPPSGTDLTQIGPVLVAWLMFSPKKRETFVDWVAVTQKGNCNFVHRLFSDRESPNGAARLLTFLKANCESSNETQNQTKAKQPQNPFLNM